MITAKEKSPSKVMLIGEGAKILINERGESFMRKVEINIYKFKELKEEIQEKVICNYIDELIATTDFEEISKNSNMYKAYKKAEKMQTPWFIGQYIWQFCEDRILKDLNKLEFEKDGEIYYEE